MSSNVLEAKDICKMFPGTLALDRVTVSFQSGLVYAVLGKNGSGKSTLMKIFSGVYKATSGNIYLNGNKIEHSSPEQALHNGIATVYQELSVINDLTVAENLMIGKLPLKNKIQVDWAEVRKKAQEAMDILNTDIDINMYVRDLTIGQRQLVEIAKSMRVNPKVLILDEPTSALSDTDCEKLFTVVRELKKKDIIIIFITHRLQEVFKIADEVVVLRDGLLIGTAEVKELDSSKLIHMMFGEIEHKYKAESDVTDEVVLEAKNLSNAKLKDVSFQLKKGEILGIAGMMGSGRTELIRAIYGLDKLDSGEIFVRGNKVKKTSPYKMKKKGCGFTSENRKEEGLCLSLSIGDNLCMANFDNISPSGRIDTKLEKQYIKKQIEELNIKVADYHMLANSLSGGNQQKVVIGNWLNTKPSILFMDEPSRGIDVNAKEQIFEVMWNQAKKGVSIIMISSELEELIEVCDRICIMRNGCLKEEKLVSELSVESIYSLCMQEA